MADKSWKAHERDFARWVQDEWLKDPEFSVRRNDARLNADNRDKNSDVDVEHEALSILRKDGRRFKLMRRGITAECTRQKSGLTMVYKWLDKAKAVVAKKPTAIVVNGVWLLCDRDDLPYFYSTLVQKATANPVPANELVTHANIVHIETSLELTIVKDKLEQSARYGHTKGLFPIVVLREPKRRQVVAFDLQEVERIIEEV